MPRNSNGIMSLPAGNPVIPGTIIESNWANPTMTDIANELTQSLPRNGSAPMTGPLTLSRDGINPNEAVTVNQLTSMTTGQNNFLPAGAVQAFAMNAVPTGWLRCDGSAISRTTYAQLFALIGTTYGVGNGTTTFNLPDLRGEFIRGFDAGRSVDPGRVFGSSQAGANAPHTHAASQGSHAHTASQGAHGHTASSGSHTHGVSDPGHTHTVPVVSQDGFSLSPRNDNNTGSGTTTSRNTTGITIAAASAGAITVGSASAGTVTVAGASAGTITVASSGTEARPRNVAMAYCIKAFGALQTDGLGNMAFQNRDAVNIEGGTGVFTTLRSLTIPTDPTDVARLADIGGLMGDIDSSDIQVLLIDKTDPRVPILRPQTNIPNGTVKLDANGRVPAGLLPFSGLNYQGPWDASGDQTPSEAFPAVPFFDGDLYVIDTPGTLTLYNSMGVLAQRSVGPGDAIIYATDSNTFPVPGWYFQPAGVSGNVVSRTDATGSAIMPAGTEAQRDVVAVEGYLRYNTDAGLFEGFTANGWEPVGDPSASVPRTAANGSAVVPSGTEAERDPVPVEGFFRYNTQNGEFEGYTANGWGQVGGGQMYGRAPVKAIFFNAQVIGEDLDVRAGENGGTFGPVTVDDGFTVTVADGSVWSVV